MTVSLAGFKARFPSDFDYTSIDDDRITMFVNLASLEVEEYSFRTEWVDEATYQLAAHFLVTEEVDVGDSGHIGVAASLGVGDKSVSFSGLPVDTEEAMLSYTKYGQRYVQLRNRIPHNRFVSS